MSVETAPERYHRRRRWPILVVTLLLLVGTGVLWFQIIKPPPAAAVGCNTPGPAPLTTAKTTRSASSAAASSGARASSAVSAPRSTAPATAKSTATSTPKSSARGSVAASSSAAPASKGVPSATTFLGTFTAAATLAATRPTDPAFIDLHVVNASKIRGQASTVTNDLQEAGFSLVADAANDTLYPANDLVCAAEIRYGSAGLRQARTVLIVAPCAQLVVDNRIGQNVDLALGANYQYQPATDAMKAQLAAIHDAAAPAAVIEGQTAAPRPLASIPPLPSVDCSARATTGSAGSAVPSGSTAARVSTSAGPTSARTSR